MAASNIVRPEKCMCGLMDVTTGTAVLGVLTIISGALGIIAQCQNIGIDRRAPSVIAVVLLLHLLTCTIGGVTVLAVVKENYKLLWPFIVVQYCGVILIFLRALAVIFLHILSAVEFAGLNELEKRDATPGDIVLLHFIFGIGTAVHVVLILLLIWFARTAKRCLEFLKAKNEASDQLKSPEGVHRSLVLDA